MTVGACFPVSFCKSLRDGRSASVRNRCVHGKPVSVKQITPNTLSLVIHPLSVEFIVELLIRESTDIFL